MAAFELLSVGATMADGALARPVVVDSGGSPVLIDHPTGVWKTLDTIGNWLFLPYFTIAAAAVVGQVLAFRRASGERRAQLEWFLAGGAISIVGFFVAIQAGSSPKGVEVVLSELGLVLVAALPVGIGVGVLKYRLYEIDRIVSRTISYLLVTGVLAAVFLGLVALTTGVLPFSSSVGVAASTLAAAALFNPLRRRAQAGVDRRFNRSRYDAEAAVSAFGNRLRDAVDPDTVGTELLDVVDRTVAPSRASLWVKTS